MPKAALKSTVFLGPKEAPVGFIKRCEIPSLFDDVFEQSFYYWQSFKKGYGLPWNGSWVDGPFYLKQCFDALDEVI